MDKLPLYEKENTHRKAQEKRSKNEEGPQHPMPAILSLLLKK